MRIYILITALICLAAQPAAWGIDVVGDGTDQTAELQAAINQAASTREPVVIKGRVYIYDHIYIYGEVSLVGNGTGTILLDGDLTYGRYWINIGCKQYGSTGSNVSPWMGRIDGVIFKVTANVTDPGPHPDMRIINIHNSIIARITNCTFDVRWAGYDMIGPIAAGNNMEFSTFVGRKNIYIRDNVLLGAQDFDGNEGISIGNCDGVWISGNYVEGFGDDVIALHLCRDFAIKDNVCHAIDGRLFLSNSQRGAVRNNSVEREPSTETRGSGGGLIWLETEYNYGYAPSDIIISQNRLKHNPHLVSPTYGVRMFNTRRCKVLNNTILDSSGWGYGVTVEVGPMTGWTDPEGHDPDNIPRARNIQIVGNIAMDPTGANNCNGSMREGAATAYNIPGPCIWAGNRPGNAGYNIFGLNSVRGYLD